MFATIKSNLASSEGDDQLVISRESLLLMVEVMNEAEGGLNKIVGKTDPKKFTWAQKVASDTLETMDFISKRPHFKKGLNQ